MRRGQILGALGVVALVIGLLATIGPAAQAVRDGIAFLWPAGIVSILAILCLLQGLLLWRRPAPQPVTPSPPPVNGQDVEGSSPPEVSGSAREKREAAYDAVLSTSEAYINAHREVDALSDPNIYPPDLEEADAVRHLADLAFVAARQRVEQHGVNPVLDAALRIEDAVNRGDYDQAAKARRDQLVPAVRKDMNRPTAAFF
jgi:hypothetical protein